MTSEEKMARLSTLLDKFAQAVARVDVAVDLYSMTHKQVDEIRARGAIEYAKLCQLELESAEREVDHDLLVSRMSLPVCAEG
jgi:hypothetical protein